MEIYWIGIMCVILCVHVKYSSGQNGLPPNPCPHMFQFQNSNGEWQGIAYVPNSQTIKLQVMLSLQAELPSQYVGKIELFGSREAAVQEIRAGLPITYRVRFPLQSPLPKLTQIAVNGQVLCSGPPATGSYVTNILLEHSFHTEQSPVSSFDNNIQSPDQYVMYDNQYSDLYSSQQPYQQPPTAPVRPQYATTTQAPIYYTHPQFNVPSYTSQSDSEICGKIAETASVKSVPLAIGGKPIERGSWPWLVAVYLKRPTGITFNCGGNLVSNKVVVTAAHCFHQYTAKDFVLFLGRHFILESGEDGSKSAEVEEIIIHSDYMKTDLTFDADVAIAIMKERVEYTEYIRPICLWDSTDTNEIATTKGTVVGWGRDGNGNVVSPEPNKVEIPIVSGEDCLRSRSDFNLITSPRTFCAGYRDGTGPCNGDSGSGMSLYRNDRWMLRGIVSVALRIANTNICNLGEYVVFTDAAKFVSWIRFYLK